MREKLPPLALAALLSACSVIPQGQTSQRQSIAQAAPIASIAPEAQACLADLGARSAAFTPLPDAYYGAGCSAVGTVRLAALKGDNAALSLANLGPVSCPLAESLAGWARYGVDRAAQQILGSRLVRIETMGSYNCRNIAGTDHRSAHATANAVDVSGFVLADGRRITVSGNWQDRSPQVRLFFSTIHSSACRRFSAVLGPNYNAAHADHLHLQVGGHRTCR